MFTLQCPFCHLCRSRQQSPCVTYSCMHAPTYSYNRLHLCVFPLPSLHLPPSHRRLPSPILTSWSPTLLPVGDKWHYTLHTSRRTCLTRRMCVYIKAALYGAQSKWWMKLDRDLWSSVLCAQRSRTRKNHKLGPAHDGWGCTVLLPWISDYLWSETWHFCCISKYKTEDMLWAIWRKKRL